MKQKENTSLFNETKYHPNQTIVAKRGNRKIKRSKLNVRKLQRCCFIYREPQFLSTIVEPSYAVLFIVNLNFL